MKKLAKLEHDIDVFYKKAAFESQQQYNSYFNSIKNRLYNLTQGGISSCNNTLANKPSPDMKVLLQNFQSCAKTCKSLSPDYDSSVDVLENLIGGMKFMTSTGNAGTGYVALTNKSFGDVKPPKYYVDIMDALVKQLKGKIREFKVVS